MKEKYSKNEGGIAIVLLLIVMVLGTLIGSYMRFALNNRRLTQRAIDFQKARMIAESAVGAGASMIYEKVQTDMLDNLTAAGLQIYLNKQTNSYTIANSGDYRVQHFKFNVQTDTPGDTFRVEISAGAINTKTQVSSAILATYQFRVDDFINYAIFTDGIFELFPHSKMNVLGKVRSNGAMRIGGLDKNRPLTFHDSVWAAEELQILTTDKAKYMFMDVNGVPISFYNGGIIDSSLPSWEALALSRWGTDASGTEALVQSKAPQLKVPIGTKKTRSIIEPYDASDSRPLQREKFSWKARNNPKYNGLYITVDRIGNISVISNGVSVAFDSATELASVQGKSGANGIYTLNNEGWIEVDDFFKDPQEYSSNRESKTKNVTVVNLYMDKLLAKHKNVDMVYVEIQDSQGRTTPYRDPNVLGTTSLSTLRIRNGHDISEAAGGLTIATHRMVYLEGNYNAQTGMTVPAMILADNVTALSNNWDDNNKSVFGKTNVKSLLASDTYYKAAFIIGGAEYSPIGKLGDIEGLQNLVRRRENWKLNGRPRALFHYEGSYIKLWNSEETKGYARDRGAGAPTRVYVYNPDFKKAPGAPRGVETPSLIRWKEISWNEAKEIAR